MINRTEAFRLSEAGATAFEYALISSLLALALIVILNVMTFKVADGLGQINFHQESGFHVTAPR
jgi:Flp pilus assembly pilin Flp